HLTGSRLAPLLDMALTLRPEPRQRLPLDQLQVTLAYAQQQLQSELRVHQANREVLTVAARLPVDLALTALPLESRWRAAGAPDGPEGSAVSAWKSGRRYGPISGEALPVALHVRLQQPDLTAVWRWLPRLPRFTGTLQGDLNVQGTYAALECDADVRLQQ